MHRVGEEMHSSAGSVLRSAAASSISRASRSLSGAGGDRAAQGQLMDPGDTRRLLAGVRVEQPERPLGEPRRPGCLGRLQDPLGPAFGIGAEPG